MYLQYEPTVFSRKRGNQLAYRYGFFVSILLCMLLASIGPGFGEGILDGNLMIQYVVVPLTYLEAGFSCEPKLLSSVLRNHHLLLFLLTFIYILTPILTRVSSYILENAGVNIWLLKGVEVLYCMPPPSSTGLALSRLAGGDLSTSVVTTLVSHFVGLLVSPVLLYFMVEASTPLLIGINFNESVLSTLMPLVIGIALQLCLTKYNFYHGIGTSWLSRGLVLLTAFHWFHDAVSTDASSLQAIDILACVFITCTEQLLIAWLYWVLCRQWLPRGVLLAALFTSTHKSIGLGGWFLRGTYHGSVHGSTVSLPLSILPVAQLLLGSLLACWLAP